MNADLVAKSLCFHGQPLQKIWEGERGSNDLSRIGITNPDYSIYTARQKTLSFQDRAKRLKLHQFIARKASCLFQSDLVEDLPCIKRKDNQTSGISVIMPPFEVFLNKNIDKSKHISHILSVIQPGDIVYGQVTSRSSSTLSVKVFCTGEPIIRFLADINIKAYVSTQNLVPAYDKKGNSRHYLVNDYVCCEVLDISADADRMSLGMKGTLTIDPSAPLGSITAEQMPEYYKQAVSNQGASYEELLEKSKSFLNPNCTDTLFQDIGLDINDNFSHMESLRNRFPQSEYASELRQVQASKWAFRSVADGIEHFKVGRHSEAFQCLNKALSIDPRNVEGLVARGALYANSGSFKKAVDDFEMALNLNPYHANARKYMGETLVALGRSYEEDNCIEEAKQAYMDCLKIIPHHEEAKSSLEFLKGKFEAGKIIMHDTVAGLKIPIDGRESPSMLRKQDDIKKDKVLKKKKLKSRKRRSSSSSESTEDSNASSNSSSDSSNSSGTSSSSDSESSKSTRQKRKSARGEKAKQKSLSPISKRMAIMDEENPTATTRYQFNQPFHLANTSAVQVDDYDTKVRNFLEMTRDEDNYESRVRKLLEDATKYRKERKIRDEKSKKKEKKKQKKIKKESKKEKRKKEKSKDKQEMDELKNMELKEALKIFKSLPMLDIENKLSADLMKYEKSIEVLQSQKHTSINTGDKWNAKNLVVEERESMPSTSNSGMKHYLPPIEPVRDIPRAKPPDTIYDIQKNTPNYGLISNFNDTKTSFTYDNMSNKRETSPLSQRPFHRDKISPSKLIKPVPAKPPVVLDKFGCFRLALDERKFETTIRRSRSISSRRRFSRSRSRSRSPRRRLSRSPRRSRSIRRSRSLRRSRSPRRSRSFRRSRSRFSRSRQRSRSRVGRRRSRSLIRRRSRSPDGGHRWNSRSRSKSYSRSLSRSPDFFRRGRRGGPPFRGNRYGRIRGRGGRGRGGGGGFRGRRSPFSRNSGGYDDKSKDYRREDSPDRRKNKKSDGIEGKWAHDKYEKSKWDEPESEQQQQNNDDEEQWDKDETTNEPSVEEIDKIIDKAQKERKEEILQRDKDLLKKQTPTNLPF